MQILGYKPIHMKEVSEGGYQSMRVFIEGVTAERNRLSGIKPYDEKDFRKWFAEYDVSPGRSVGVFFATIGWVSDAIREACIARSGAACVEAVMGSLLETRVRVAARSRDLVELGATMVEEEAVRV